MNEVVRAGMNSFRRRITMNVRVDHSTSVQKMPVIVTETVS